MKNNIMKFLWVMVFILGPVIVSLAQPPRDALGGDAVLPNSGAPSMNCSGAPIGNGYWILLALAFSYGAYQIWQMHKKTAKRA